MTSLWYRNVTLGRQGAVALLILFIAQWVLSTLVSAQTIIIPSISASETYDSNVFSTPKSLLGPDQKPEDYITRVIPQINMFRAGSLVSGGLFGGAGPRLYGLVGLRLRVVACAEPIDHDDGLVSDDPRIMSDRKSVV